MGLTTEAHIPGGVLDNFANILIECNSQTVGSTQEAYT